jgi:hypothetical protein
MLETLTIDESAVQEEFFERGWTDGLPIMPPTPDRVGAMIDVIDGDPETLIGFVPARNRGVTVEQAAANAVMAGCKPAYFPVVMAALEAMFDPAFNAHTALSSTGGAALCTVISGPVVGELEMRARGGVLGPGNRANATIGRALRLVAMNVLGARTGEMDASSFGHHGKYTFVVPEDPPPAPWRPLAEELGYAPGDSTVTLLPLESSRQIAHQLDGVPERVLRSVASMMKAPASFCAGKGAQGLVMLGPEHAWFCIEAGWTQQQVRDFLFRESMISVDELEAAGVSLEPGGHHDMTPDENGMLKCLGSPDEIYLVTCGGEGAGWSAYAPSWAPKIHATAATRRIRPVGEPLPDCGPDGCIVPWAR